MVAIGLRKADLLDAGKSEHHWESVRNSGGPLMRGDDARIDEAVLGLLYLTSFVDHGLTRAWKSHDWDALNRLHARGLIDNPRNSNKSLTFTEEGFARAESAFAKLFASGSSQ